MIKKGIIIGAIIGFLCGLQILTTSAASVLLPQQGGTGISTSTSGNNTFNLYQVSVDANGHPVYGFQANGAGGGGVAVGAGITSTISGTTTTVILNLGAGCSGNNFVATISPTGTITCSTPSGGASSTNVFGINGVTVNQVGVNATASLNTAFAASWTALETFLNGATINGTTTLASTTNALLLTDTTGKVLAYAGSNVCGAGNYATAISATGTITCTAGVSSVNGSTGAITITSSTLGVATNTLSLFNGNGFITNISTTINTAGPLGGGGALVNGTTLNLTCTGCLTGNQTITFTPSQDVSGTASGATSLTPTLKVIGLQGKALPSLSSGTLYYYNGAWSIGNAVDQNGNQFVTSTGASSGGVGTSSPATGFAYFVNGNTISGTSTVVQSLANNSAAGGIDFSAATGTGITGVLHSLNISQFTNNAGYLITTSTIAASGTTLTGPAFTFASTTSIAPFASGTAMYWTFVNTAGYITTSSNNFGGLTNSSISANAPITWSAGSVIGFNTSTALSLSGLYTFLGGLTANSTATFNSSTILGATKNALLGTDANGLIVATTSGVAAGSYTNTNLTVDATGRITTASNGTAGGGGGLASSTPWTANFFTLVKDGVTLMQSMVQQFVNGLKIATGTGTWPVDGASNALLTLGSSSIQGGNASGTWLGVNASSGFSGDFINFQVQSSTKFEVSAAGNTTTTNLTVTGVTSGLGSFSSAGVLSAYAGSSCTVGSLVTSISAAGAATCNTTSSILTGYNPLSFNDANASSGIAISTSTTKISIQNIGVTSFNGATGTVSAVVGGNLFVSPTSTTLANNVVKFQTAGSSTVAQTSSIYAFNDGGASVNTSTENGLFTIVNASNTQALGVSSTTNATSSAVTLNIKGNASSSPTVPINVLQVLSDGHINATGTTPTVSACGSGSPSVKGTDASGVITIGTGAVSSCKLTFQVPYESTNVIPIVNDSSSTDAVEVTSVSSSSITMTFASSLTGGSIYYFILQNF